MTGKSSFVLSGATEVLTAVEPLRSEHLQFSCLYCNKKKANTSRSNC